MPLLKQEITTRGIQGGVNNPDEDMVVHDLDPMVLLEMQAAFGSMLYAHPQLTRLINNLGPVLFATLLFTAMEEYQVDPNDADMVAPTKDIFEAESAAIGMIRSVASAMGKLSGEVTVTPSDQEIDQDTNIISVG